MELLQVADAVAREKNIDQEVVIEALEEAIQKAGRSKYGHDHDIRATIDRSSGVLELKRYQTVTEEEEIENESAQITLKQAQRIKPGAEMGEVLVDELPPLDYGRIAAQTARQVILQKVREAEREKQYEEFKDRSGEMISGIVKRVEFGNVTVDLGKAEGVIRRDECIPRENLRNGDRVRAYIYDVRRELRGPQIFLSRSHPQFMAELFKQEVPEIYEGVIEIRSVARDPGSRAKITVYSRDSGIDPVGACVGMRGSRVQAVVGELQGEKIDIINWTEDFPSLVINALSPAQVARVVVNEDEKRIDVAVPEDQLSLAIGRRGQNVRLASILLGWDIDIMTEAEESERRAKEFASRTSIFMEGLDVDDVIAHLLVAEGFTSIEEIIETPTDELAQIEGFSEEVATELQSRAKSFLEMKAKELKDKQTELGISDDLIELSLVPSSLAIKLGENGIKSRDDLADLAADELVELLGADQMNSKDANDIIMNAREHWFAKEDAAAAAAEETATEEAKEGAEDAPTDAPSDPA